MGVTKQRLSLPDIDCESAAVHYETLIWSLESDGWLWAPTHLAAQDHSLSERTGHIGQRNQELGSNF